MRALYYAVRAGIVARNADMIEVILAAEVFPTRTRSIGTAVATCCNWAFNVLFSEVSPIAMSNVAWKFYVLFIALNFVSFVVILLFFPETKGNFHLLSWGNIKN